MVLLSYADFAPVISHVSRVLPDMGLRSIVLLGLVSLAVLSLGRASAATRHWVWLLGFVGLLLLPSVSATVPVWRVLPHLFNGSPAAGASGMAAVISIEDSAPGQPQQDLSMATINRSPTPAHETRPVLAANALPPVQQPTAQGGVAVLPVVHRPASQWALRWTGWLALVWLVGGAMVLAHLLLGYLSLWLLQHRCARIDDGECHEQLNRLRQLLNIRRAVNLLSIPGRAMPMTWGLWHATLLLPDESANWPIEHRKDVLLHELGHVRRFDCATQLLVQIACALYWFNPLVWIARNRVQVERERACDDIVLNTGATAQNYARHLLQSATAMPVLRFVTAALAMARPSTLEARLSTILDSGRNRRAMSASALWMTLAVLLISLAPFAALRAQENPAAPANTGQHTAPAASAAAAPATRPALSRDPGARPVGRGGFGGGAAQEPLKLGEGPTCAFDATVYDVRLPVDKISQLDLDALTKAAATPVEFEKALAELGTARPLYHTDQAVRLATDTIRIGTQVPFVTSTHRDANGHAINTVQYQSLGAIFEMAGKSVAADRIDFDLSIQLSAITDSSAAIAPDIKSPLFRTATMSHKGSVGPKTPFVVISADAASADENGKAVAYIARITVGAPQ